MDVPEPWIHEAGSGFVPRRHTLAVDLRLVSERTSDDRDDRGPWVRVPAQRAIRSEAEVPDEHVCPVVLDGACKRRNFEIRNVAVRREEADRDSCGVDLRHVRGDRRTNANRHYQRGYAGKDPFQSHFRSPFSV